MKRLLILMLLASTALGQSLKTKQYLVIRGSGTVSAPIPQYNIYVTNPGGCTITPLGNVLADSNATVVFTLSANSGYTLDSLYVDGSKVTPATGYTFTAIKADHTLRAYTTATYIALASSEGHTLLSSEGHTLILP